MKYSQKVLSYSEEDIKKAWINLAHVEKKAEIIQKKAKKEAIDKMTKILAETTEKETLNKLEKICDSLERALLNAVYGEREEVYRDSISKK